MSTCTPLEDRFWPKVAVASDDECWTWQANRNNHGYGLIRLGGTARKVLAHRAVYEMRCGPIPDGMVVLHRCDNPRCVNPAHLLLGTMRQNTADMYAKGRARPYGIDIECRDIFQPRKRVRASRGPKRRGELNHMAKLTEELVMRYRAELAAGKPLRQLARETGLDRKTLMSMRDRRSWAHVP